MTWIGRTFTYLRASVSSVFYRNPSAFIMPKPCGFSTPRTRMPTGIRGHALQRRDSGRHHLRLIFVSLSGRIQKIIFILFPIINENGYVSRFSIIFWYEKINNELVRTPYELTLPEFVLVRFSSLFSRYFISCSFINQGIWRSL